VQVTANADLVGDDGGVFGVGLALAAVALGSSVDGTAGEVEHWLIVIEEDRDGQGGSAVSQVNAPGHLVAYIGEELEELGFVIGDASGQQPTAALVDRDAVVVGFACVDAGPDRGHVVPPCGVVLVPPDGRPRCRFPTWRSFAIPNWQPSRRGASGGQSMEATDGRTLKATPDAPGWMNHTKGSPRPAGQRRQP
jgi:hypothetical protein